MLLSDEWALLKPFVTPTIYTGKTEIPVFFDKVLTKIFGTANERLIKRLMPMVALISALEADTKQTYRRASCGPRRSSSGRGLRSGLRSG